MTQPQFTPLSTVYTRALRLLGLVPAQRQLQTPLTVQPVQIISDVSDASIPHSNPIFGFNVVLAAPGAADSAMISLQARSRIVRLRQVFFQTASAPRMFVANADLMTTVDTTLDNTTDGSSLGPTGTATGAMAASRSIVRGGQTVGAANPANAYRPETVQFDLRPPLLLNRNQFIYFIGATLNSALTVSGLYEEIPNQDEVADLGFPEVNEQG